MNMVLDEVAEMPGVAAFAVGVTMEKDKEEMRLHFHNMSPILLI